MKSCWVGLPAVAEVLAVLRPSDKWTDHFEVQTSRGTVVRCVAQRSIATATGVTVKGPLLKWRRRVDEGERVHPDPILLAERGWNCAKPAQFRTEGSDGKQRAFVFMSFCLLFQLAGSFTYGEWHDALHLQSCPGLSTVEKTFDLSFDLTSWTSPHQTGFNPALRQWFDFFFAKATCVVEFPVFEGRVMEGNERSKFPSSLLLLWRVRNQSGEAMP